MRGFVLNTGFFCRKLISGLKLPAFGYKVFLIIAYCIFGASGIIKADPVTLKPDKNILIFFAQSPSTPAYRILLEGIRQKLDNEYGIRYNLHTEYLEQEHYPKGAYPREQFDIYNQKYRTIKLDLLICVGVDIVSTIKKHAENYLLKLPVITIDYDLSRYGMKYDLVLNDKNDLISLKLNLGRTLHQAMDLFPNASNIYFICGVARSDSLFLLMSQQEAAKISNRKKVIFFTDMSMDEVLRKVRNLPPNSIIMLSSFIMDSRRVPYYNYESLRLISKASNVPVFAYTDMGFGEGAIGGYILSFRKVAENAGNAAVSILNGGNPGLLHFSESDCYENMFDWRILKRWHIENSPFIPKGSIIMFREKDYFDIYKWQIVAVMLFIILESLLIVYLFRINHRQKEIMNQKVEAEFLYRKIFREERLQRMSELTASLSHELNQPLTATIYNAQALKRWINSESPDRRKIEDILDHIIKDNKRAGSIISSIRSLMKLESREKENIYLNRVIQDTVRLCYPDLNQNRITIEVAVPDKPVIVLGDRIQLQQVLINLILNASNAMLKMPAGERRITITLKEQENRAVVTVSDTGPGIDEKIIDRIFKPFITSGQDGFGIGLALSRTIIENHEGKIVAANLPGGGARFSFSLKLINA